MSETTTTTTPASTRAPAASVPAAAPARGSVSEGLNMHEFMKTAEAKIAAEARVKELEAALATATGESTKLKEQIAASEQQRAAAEAATKAARAKEVVSAAAKSARAHDADAVLALIPQDALTAAGNGESEAVTKAIEAMAKDKPWLFKPTESRGTGGKPNVAGGGEAPNVMEMDDAAYAAAREAVLRG